MQLPRIALLQNQLTVDGRSRVLGEMVQVINEMGAVPDVHTLATDANLEVWRHSRAEAEPLRFNVVRPVPVALLRGYIYQTFLHNWLSRERLKGYDVVINSNDLVAFLPASVRRIHYIHFPLGQVFAQVQRYQELRWKIATLPVRLATARLERSLAPGDIVCTNSAYSARWIARQWPGISAEVLPPPVAMPEAPQDGAPRDIDVVTLGAITPDKGQLEQLQIAARLRGYTFVLIGYAPSPRYHAEVLRTIEALGLTNVRVITDASREAVHDYLGRARVFLHTKRDEHFGISIAEAVGRGCVPVIHDSGGQTEIVPEPRLRFRDADEAARILAALLDGSTFPTRAELAGLREHVRRFRPEVFRARFAALLRGVLGGAAPGEAPSYVPSSSP